MIKGLDGHDMLLMNDTDKAAACLVGAARGWVPTGINIAFHK
jgi:hypothetical protein